MKRIVALLMLVPLLSGCAVGMALSGKGEPEIDDIRKGMAINEVHFIMRNYTPVINDISGKRSESYTIDINNEPSAGRALGHLAMNVLTWGAWEIIGTPMEALSSKRLILTIIYEDEDGLLVVDKIIAGKEKGGI